MFTILFRDTVIGFANGTNNTILNEALSIVTQYISEENPTFIHIDVLPNSCSQWSVGNILVLKAQDHYTLYKVVEKEVTNWAYITKKKLRSTELGMLKIYIMTEDTSKIVSGAAINALKQSIIEHVEINDEIARDRDKLIAEISVLNSQLTVLSQRNCKYKTTLLELVALFNQATGKNIFSVEDSILK